MLAVVPARTETELDPATAHRVDLRHRDGQRPGEPEGDRRDERAEAQPRRVAGEPGEGDPGVGRAGEAVAEVKLM